MIRVRAVHLAVALIAAGTAACARGPEAGPIEIRGVALPPPAGQRLEVTGLSGGELRALERAQLDEAGWQAVLRVTVAGNDMAAVAGRYEITSAALRFVPQFSFDAGRSPLPSS